MATQPKTEFTRIALGIDPPTARIHLQNPPLNIIDLAMMEELRAALEQVNARADVTAIVFSGSERAFSAGVDVAAHTPDKVGEMLAKFHAVIRALVATEKVTIAVVRGHCLGGGAELAMVCDLVYAADNATWQFPEIKLGCFPPIACAALAPLAGQRAAADLVLTARKFTGAEAKQFGLVNDAVPDEQVEARAEAAIARLAELSPAALRLAKKALWSWEAAHFDKALARAELIYLGELVKTHDANEGIRAFIERRKPEWRGK